MFQNIGTSLVRPVIETGWALLKDLENSGEVEKPPQPPGTSLLRRLVGLLVEKGKGLNEICASLILSSELVARIVAFTCVVSPHERPMRIYSSPRFWSLQQKQLLLKLWPTDLSIEEIAARIGRNRASVLTKARSFGLYIRSRRVLQDLARESCEPACAGLTEIEATTLTPPEVPSAVLNQTTDAIIIPPPCQGLTDNNNAAGVSESALAQKVKAESSVAENQLSLFPMPPEGTKQKPIKRKHNGRRKAKAAKAAGASLADKKVRRKRTTWNDEMKLVIFGHFDCGLTSLAAALVTGLTEAAVRSYWNKVGLAGRDKDKIWKDEGPSPYRGAADHLVETIDKHTLKTFWCLRQDKGKNLYSPATRKSKWAKENDIARKYR